MEFEPDTARSEVTELPTKPRDSWRVQLIEKDIDIVFGMLVSSSCRCAFFATSIFEIRKSKFVVIQHVKGALSRYSVIFLRHFVVRKNNGGRASFQTKRAQQVSCLSIIVVYIVLCSGIHKCTWKIASLERSSDQDSWRSIRGAAKACFSLASAVASSLLAAIFDRKKSTKNHWIAWPCTFNKRVVLFQEIVLLSWRCFEKDNWLEEDIWNSLVEA